MPKFKLAIGEVHLKLNNLWATEAGMVTRLMFVGMAIPDPHKRFRNEFLEKFSNILEATYGKDLANSKARVQASLSKYVWCDLILSKRFNKTCHEIISMSSQQDLAAADSDSDGDDDDDDRQATTEKDNSMIGGSALPAGASFVQNEPHFSGKGSGRERGSCDPG